jgi:hypothetical protein
MQGCRDPKHNDTWHNDNNRNDTHHKSDWHNGGGPLGKGIKWSGVFLLALYNRFMNAGVPRRSVQ